MSAISIPKGSIKLAGLLFKPDSPPTGKLPGVIVIHPDGGIKKHTASTYAKKLSQNGYVATCYDAANEGELDVTCRFLEDPASGVTEVARWCEAMT